MFGTVFSRPSCLQSFSGSIRPSIHSSIHHHHHRQRTVQLQPSERWNHEFRSFSQGRGRGAPGGRRGGGGGSRFRKSGGKRRKQEQETVEPSSSSSSSSAAAERPQQPSPAGKTPQTEEASRTQTSRAGEEQPQPHSSSSEPSSSEPSEPSEPTNGSHGSSGDRKNRSRSRKRKYHGFKKLFWGSLGAAGVSSAYALSQLPEKEYQLFRSSFPELEEELRAQRSALPTMVRAFLPGIPGAPEDPAELAVIEEFRDRLNELLQESMIFEIRDGFQDLRSQLDPGMEFRTWNRRLQEKFHARRQAIQEKLRTILRQATQQPRRMEDLEAETVWGTEASEEGLRGAGQRTTPADRFGFRESLLNHSDFPGVPPSRVRSGAAGRPEKDLPTVVSRSRTPAGGREGGGGEATDDGQTFILDARGFSPSELDLVLESTTKTLSGAAEAGEGEGEGEGGRGRAGRGKPAFLILTEEDQLGLQELMAKYQGQLPRPETPSFSRTPENRGPWMLGLGLEQEALLQDPDLLRDYLRNKFPETESFAEPPSTTTISSIPPSAPTTAGAAADDAEKKDHGPVDWQKVCVLLGVTIGNGLYYYFQLYK